MKINKCINEDTDENEIVKGRNIHCTKIDNNDLIPIYNFYTSNKNMCIQYANNQRGTNRKISSVEK